jgi:hypothetical protein
MYHYSVMPCSWQIREAGHAPLFVVHIVVHAPLWVVHIVVHPPLFVVHALLWVVYAPVSCVCELSRVLL